ncbi:MAG: pyridoxal phosphate-dependent aminotransferase [Bdellovibrionota bacterium]|nr:MAG: pyridoxal phosphate-dependent aminotransferase [Bdellovibrionota bacterium]
MQNKLVHRHFASPMLRQVGFQVARVKGVNLAQGLCIMPVPQCVIEAARGAIADGKNLYAAAQGVEELRTAIAGRLASFNRMKASSEQVLITPGSTGAFEVICEAFLRPGDEVVSFIPFYPYHRNTLARRGVTVRYVQLHRPDWSFSRDELLAACSARTKFVLITNPHNPTGKVFSEDELQFIGQVCTERDLFCVTDEVYEYMTYDGRKHISLAALPNMAEHTITMSSYSKTFAITGWRIGYLVSPPAVADTLKTIADQMFVCPPTPLQHGVAAGVRELGPQYYSDLLESYEKKRALLSNALLESGFPHHPPDGAYYIVAHTSERFPGISSEEVVQRMIDECGVGAVPASDFLGPQVLGDPEASTFMRFSCAVPDEMLADAASRLRSW